MAHHIEKYFSSVQLSDLPNDQFSDLIAHLLETTTCMFENFDEIYKCPFCSNILFGMQKARTHLVVEHRPFLKEKLVELQKSNSKLAQSPEIIETSVSNISNIDDTTKVTLKKKSGLSKEKSQRYKTKPLKSVFSCANCSISFLNYCRLFRHDLHNHPEKHYQKSWTVWPRNSFRIALLIWSPQLLTNLKVDSKYQCNFCSQTLSLKPNTKSHLVLKHRSILKEKLVELQNSSNIKLIINTNRRTTTRRTNNEKTLNTRNKPYKSYL